MSPSTKPSRKGGSAAPKAKAKKDVAPDHRSGSEDEELVEPSQLSTYRTTAHPHPSQPASSKSGFRAYLGTDAEAILEAASAETRAGFRPDRGSKSALPKPPKNEAAAPDAAKGQPGRKKKPYFAVRAVAWISSGVDDCAGERAPDYGACTVLAKQGLAVVVEREGGLQFPRECSEAEIYDWLAREDMFGHIFAYYDQQLNPPTRSIGKGKGKAIVRRKTTTIVQVKSSGGSRRLEPARDEPICGAAIEGRFPSAKGWGQRYLYFTGPIPIPQEVIELWSSVREPQAAPNSKDGEENESESQDGNDDNDDDNYDNDDDDDANGDENDHSGEEMRVDVPEEEAGDVDSRKNHSAIGNVASHAKHHRRSQRVISGASTATSASQATSVGQKRGRSVTPEGSAAGRSPPRKQIRKAKGNPAKPIIISDDDEDYQEPGPSKRRPRPQTRSASGKANTLPSLGDGFEASVNKLDRQVSDLFIGTFIDADTMNRLAGSDSDC